MTKPDPVYILLVEVGRAPGDDLPEGCTGAALMCYAAGRTEKQAVDETVKILREAGLAPLEVTPYGTSDAPEITVDPDELALMARARDENAVIVAQITHFTD